MDTGIRRFRAATLLLGWALMWGCAAPGKAVQSEEERPAAKPVSVRLPVLTPMKIEPPSTPPGLEPSIAPAEVQEGEARSLKVIEVDYTRGKPGPPVGHVPHSPADNASSQEKPR